MLITENKVLRNLQEQVAKNKSDISDILEARAVIAEFGIRVVGEVDTEAELPDPATYSGEYGDAYTVGTQTPYDYYIFTRPNDDIPTAHWFNVGQFPMPGPQGEPGLPGAKGDKGSMIYVENMNPTLVTGYNVGDLWINTSDNALFQLNNNGWDRVGYIKGDTGPKGPKGDKGDTGAPGTPLNIVGVLSTVDLLPNPSTVSKATTYLVGASAPYTIYVIVGDIDDKSTWEWQALAVGGTNVTVNNQPVGTFNADSKLDKVASAASTAYNRVYAVDTSGNQFMLNAGQEAGPYSLVSRDAHSYVIVPETPTAGPQATSKKYVDNGLNKKLDKVTNTSDYWRAYVVTPDQVQTVKDLGPNAGAWSLVGRDGDSQIIVPETPTIDTNATSKKYVDTGLNGKLDKVTTTSNNSRVYSIAIDGTQSTKVYTSNTDSYTLVERTNGGQIKVPTTPTSDNHATSKAYVDTATKGTETICVINSSISAGQKDGFKFNCQDNTGKIGVYAVNDTTHFVGIVVMISTSFGILYGHAMGPMSSGVNLVGHKLM